MRLSGEWIYRKQGWDDLPDQFTAAWLGIGFFVADLRRCSSCWRSSSAASASQVAQGQSGTDLLKATMGIALVLAVSFVVAVWAMTGKPN